MKNGKKNGIRKAVKKNGIRKTVKKLDIQQLMERPCSECGGKVQRKVISQEFEREGIRIKISGFKAWACTRCGEIYFAPGEADKLVQAANSLFALALAGNQHKGKIMAKVS